jgi:hypothetical protein
MLDAPAVASQSKHLSDVLDIIDKATKIIALFIGACWAYLNYRRGRTFKRRLEPTVTGKTIRSKGVLLLSGVAQVKNVGLSKVTIEQRGTAIEVLAVVSHSKGQELTLGTKDVDVLSVFEAHGWIEPGEVVEESFLVPVPEHPEMVAFRLRLRIVSEHIEWNCDSVVETVGDHPSGEAARPAPRAKSSHGASAGHLADEV